MMTNKRSIYCQALAITIILLIDACSIVKEKKSANEQQDQQTSSQTVAIAAPVEISITSLTELSALFDELKYTRKQCTKNDCEIPRITFNGVSREWQETADKLPVQLKKEMFFQLMAPLILIANEHIKHERKIIENSRLNSQAVKQIALKYRVISSEQSKLDTRLRKKLLQRVDIVPPSLALAQAAEESGWATSRFAIEGNAFFGQWDFSGNGMKPRAQRKQLGNYGVARFNTPLACVEAYMLNINSNKAYQKLRILRAQLRRESHSLSGYKLAATLNNYSERGQAYSDGLRSMIRYNKLPPMDQATLADIPLIHINMH